MGSTQIGQGLEMWLTERETSEMTGISRSTLQKHRFYGKGIPYVKIGSSIRYSVKAIKAFMDANTVLTSVN